MKLNTEIRKVVCEQGVLEYQLTRKQVKNIQGRLYKESIDMNKY